MAHPTPKSASSLPRKKRTLILGLLGATVVLATGAAVYGKLNRPPHIDHPHPHPPPRQFNAEFQAAKNLIREGKWAEAKAALLELQQKAPEMEMLQDYLDRAEKEIPNQEHLDAAQAALGEKKLATAKAELDQISADTTMFEQVSKLRRELRDSTEALVKEGRELLDTQQPERARELADEVLRVFPDHRDAMLVHAEATRLTEKPAVPANLTPWEQAVTRFVDGDMSGAMDAAEKCQPQSPKCRSGLRKMKDFATLYKRLEDLDAKGLARLLALDKELTETLGPSKMARNAGTRAANIYYKSASAAKAAGQYARAVEYAKRTLEADPGHVGAQRILNELRTWAKDSFLQAYSLKDENPEEAIPKFREVMAMTPPEDETHQKAKIWLEKLTK
jgi:tetratricopeptide (TPR) repeat protein